MSDTTNKRIAAQQAAFEALQARMADGSMDFATFQKEQAKIAMMGSLPVVARLNSGGGVLVVDAEGNDYMVNLNNARYVGFKLKHDNGPEAEAIAELLLGLIGQDLDGPRYGIPIAPKGKGKKKTKTVYWSGWKLKDSPTDNAKVLRVLLAAAERFGLPIPEGITVDSANAIGPRIKADNECTVAAPSGPPPNVLTDDTDDDG
jgi:hypothetical protein